MRLRGRNFTRLWAQAILFQSPGEKAQQSREGGHPWPQILLSWSSVQPSWMGEVGERWQWEPLGTAFYFLHRASSCDWVKGPHYRQHALLNRLGLNSMEVPFLSIWLDVKKTPIKNLKDMGRLCFGGGGGHEGSISSYTVNVNVITCEPTGWWGLGTWKRHQYRKEGVKNVCEPFSGCRSSADRWLGWK